jgi:hypothetical protein
MVDDRRQRATGRARTWPVEACGNRRTRRVNNGVPGSARGRMVDGRGIGWDRGDASRPAGNSTRREGRLVAVGCTGHDWPVGIACQGRYRHRSSRRLASGGMTSHPGTMALGVHCRPRVAALGVHCQARPTRAAVAPEVAVRRPGTGAAARRCLGLSNAPRWLFTRNARSIATESSRLRSSTRAGMAGKDTSRGRSGLDAKRAGSARRDAGQAIERNRSR